MGTEAEVLRYHPGAQAGVDEIAAAVLAVAQEAEEADAAIRAAIAVRAVLGQRLNTDQRRRALRAVVRRIDVTLSEHQQGRGASGGYAATPRRKVDTMDFHLRYGDGVSDTTRSRCDRGPVTVRVVDGGNPVSDLRDAAARLRRGTA